MEGRLIIEKSRNTNGSVVTHPSNIPDFMCRSFHLFAGDVWDVTCLSAEPGLKYRGEENTTTSGQVCKSWTDVEVATNMTTFFANQGTPVKISELNETLADAENHCRNLLQLPTNAPFCFTGLALTTAEVCNISLCPTGMYNSLASGAVN